MEKCLLSLMGCSDGCKKKTSVKVISAYMRSGTEGTLIQLIIHPNQHTVTVSSLMYVNDSVTDKEQGPGKCTRRKTVPP